MGLLRLYGLFLTHILEIWTAGIAIFVGVVYFRFRNVSNFMILLIQCLHQVIFVLVLRTLLGETKVTIELYCLCF